MGLMMIAQFNQTIASGAAGALEAMHLDGCAFTGETPVSFDPATKTMSLSMAGCSIVVAVSGTRAGKIGTLYMNSTASFDVSGAQFDQSGKLASTISKAKGTSNCTTVILIEAPSLDFRLGRSDLPSYSCIGHDCEGGDLDEILYPNSPTLLRHRSACAFVVRVHHGSGRNHSDAQEYQCRS